MTRSGIGAAVFLVAALYASIANAGVYTDDLTKCLVDASTAEDRTTLVQWIFGLLSLNPSVTPLTSITAAQRDDLSRKTIGIMERLLNDNCHAQTVNAFKYEGPAIAIATSFQILGQVAARGLMSDPNVAAGMGDISKMSNKDLWANLYKEAGLPAPPDTTGPAPK